MNTDYCASRRSTSATVGALERSEERGQERRLSTMHGGDDRTASTVQVAACATTCAAAISAVLREETALRSYEAEMEHDHADLRGYMLICDCYECKMALLREESNGAATKYIV